MKLDFCQQGRISPVHLMVFNRIAFETRLKFTDLISSVSQKQIDNLDWHISGPAERNIFASPLFDYCCRFIFLQKLIDDGEPIGEVVTDSPAFKKLIKQLLSDRKINIPVRLEHNSLKQSLNLFSRIVGYLFVELWEYLTGYLSGSGKAELPEEPLTLVDTFVMAGFLGKDRYYPGLLDGLTKEEQRLIYFVPTFFRIQPFKMYSVWKKLRKGERNFLFKEDFLKIRDYLFAWSHWLRARKIPLKDASFCGYDFSPLLIEEIKSCRGLRSSMIGILNYRFVCRLKEHGVRIRLSVDWFENQVIDKGWNYGFKKFYPDTPTVGYLGFVTTSFYLCALPTHSDNIAGLLPERLAVMGKALIPTVMEFNHRLKVEAAPAFRFQHLYKRRRFFPDPERFTILVGLSFSLTESARILTQLAHVHPYLEKDVFFRIKMHPTLKYDQLQSYLNNYDEKQTELVDEPFDELLEKCNLLISGVSSVSMESLAKGVPVIVIGSNSGMTLTPIPKGVDSEMWRICHSVEEIKTAIELYRKSLQSNPQQRTFRGESIRDAYFSPVNVGTVRHFLRVDKI